MLIYLADLYHDYLPTRQHVPLGVGYIGEYLKSQYPEEVEIVLFKSADKLLDKIDERRPEIVGLSNYTWNEALNHYVGTHIKNLGDYDVPIVMGGPNISSDENDIAIFLNTHNYVDRYVLYAGERSMAEIIGALLDMSRGKRSGKELRNLHFTSSYALTDEGLNGGAEIDGEKNLDFVPSPYLSGALDEFLDAGFLPIVESNRGCPFSCTFCVWGISALSKIKQFSMDRVRAELDYIGMSNRSFSEIIFADANFGILKRDVQISQHIRDLYEKYNSFQAVQIYWSKSAQPHMIDIGKILGDLTHTYVAFQSLDPVVLDAIKRKNISTEKLVELINELRKYTHSTQTDLLVGLPNESFDSHIRSLNAALNYGINHIQGGEIRLLPGSEMASAASRKQYKIKTKYRLCEGQYGLYRGQLVSEFEEVIRQTSTITEEEMLQLRVLRTIFYASVTLGEHSPLISYLVKNDIPVFDFFKCLVKPDPKYPSFDRALAWCSDRARQEWFDSLNGAREFIELPENASALFGQNSFLKLNYGMLARLICNKNEYEEFACKIENTLITLIPEENPSVLRELVYLCKSRNLVYRLLHGNDVQDKSVILSLDTCLALGLSDYSLAPNDSEASRHCELYINPLTEEMIAKKVSDLDGEISILGISQILESFRGRSYMELKTNSDVESNLLTSSSRTGLPDQTFSEVYLSHTS